MRWGCRILSPGRIVAWPVLVLMLIVGPASAWGQPARSEAPPAPGAPQDKESGYHVLLLYSESRLTASVVSADQAFRATLEAHSPRPVYFYTEFLDFYTEFLDLNAFQGALIQPGLHDLIRRKYKGRPMDLVVAQGQLTVPFVLQERANTFAGAPVVFMGVERSTFADLPPASGVTGTWRRRGWRDTLDLARRLHPGTRRAVVIVGSSAGERFWLESAREQLAASAGAIQVDYLVDASFENVLKTVAALPKDGVVLLGPFLRDGTGRDFATPMVARRIFATSNVPVYALTEGVVGTGVVGGHVMSFEAHGRVAAELALKVLTGKQPPPTTEGTTIPVFDDRQFKRWGIDRRLLPAGSTVLFREPSLWEHYRGYVIGAVSLVLVQSGLIGALLVQRAQRRRAQRILAERLRFETLLATISQALASCPVPAIDREMFTGLRRIVEDMEADRATLWLLDDDLREARVTHSWNREGVAPMATVIPEDKFPWVFTRIRRGEVLCLPPRQLEATPSEAQTDLQSLERIGIRSTAVAPLEEGGVVVGGLSVSTVLEERRWPDELVPRLRLLADIFANALARQRAERAARESARDIRDLAGRLMTAEEDERRRIARELHDGVNQDLAALSIALSALQDGLPTDTPVARREEFTRLQGRTVELAGAIRHLSHELHPGILQYAGLGAALRSYCREFQREHNLAVEYRATDDLGTIPPDVALCLYRVTQEALRNAGRHAKASRAWVAVERHGPDLALTIRDDGRGFDLVEARSGGGLGLISLDERVRLAGGRLTIDTEPQRGTRIHVLVALADRSARDRGA